MAYQPPTHGILTPYPWYINPLPMVYRPPYPWYIDPNPWYFDPLPHGISTPLPMVYQTFSYGIMNSSLLVEMRGGSKYNDKKLTPGSKYHMEN
jgi:hypothetical protein